MKKSTITIVICLITVLLIGCVFAQAKTPDASRPARHKYYRSIEIQQGDTLWTIAKENMTEEYTSVDDYVEEIREINGFIGDTIFEGGYLMVPYYAD